LRIRGEMLAPIVNARDTADTETPASRATSAADAFLAALRPSISFSLAIAAYFQITRSFDRHLQI
jgi:hypothetical protein